MSKIKWRAELIDVKKSRDEVWIAEKFQSNSEIAVLLEIVLGLALFRSIWG